MLQKRTIDRLTKLNELISKGYSLYQIAKLMNVKTKDIRQLIITVKRNEKVVKEQESIKIKPRLYDLYWDVFVSISKEFVRVARLDEGTIVDHAFGMPITREEKMREISHKWDTFLWLRNISKETEKEILEYSRK